MNSRSSSFVMSGFLTMAGKVVGASVRRVVRANDHGWKGGGRVSVRVEWRGVSDHCWEGG